MCLLVSLRLRTLLKCKATLGQNVPNTSRHEAAASWILRAVVNKNATLLGDASTAKSARTPTPHGVAATETASGPQQFRIINLAFFISMHVWPMALRAESSSKRMPHTQRSTSTCCHGSQHSTPICLFGCSQPPCGCHGALSLPELAKDHPLAVPLRGVGVALPL